MNNLDRLALVLPLGVFLAGSAVDFAGEWAFRLGVAFAVLAIVTGFSSLVLALRVVMDFADDGGARAWIYAAQLVLRAGSVMWIWMAIALWALAAIHGEQKRTLQNASVLSLCAAGAIFLIGMAWFFVYAAAKHQVHKGR